MEPNELDMVSQQVENLTGSVNASMETVTNAVSSLADSVRPMVEREAAAIVKAETERLQKDQYESFKNQLVADGFEITKVSGTRSGAQLATEERADAVQSPPSAQQQTIQGAMDADEDDDDKAYKEFMTANVGKDHHYEDDADMDKMEEDDDMEEKGGPREGVATVSSPRRSKDPDQTITSPKPGRELWKDMAESKNAIRSLTVKMTEMAMAITALPDTIGKSIDTRMATKGWQLAGVQPTYTGSPAVPTLTGQEGGAVGDIPILKASDGTPMDREAQIGELRKLSLAAQNDLHTRFLAGALPGWN